MATMTNATFKHMYFNSPVMRQRVDDWLIKHPSPNLDISPLDWACSCFISNMVLKDHSGLPKTARDSAIQPDRGEMAYNPTHFSDQPSAAEILNEARTRRRLGEHAGGKNNTFDDRDDRPKPI